MAISVAATEVVRKFSEILSSIRLKGSRYTITRRGKPVAMMGPIEPAIHEATLGELKRLLKKIPRLGDEAEAFAADLEETLPLSSSGDRCGRRAPSSE